jgi:hypothetical protein
MKALYSLALKIIALIFLYQMVVIVFDMVTYFPYLIDNIDPDIFVFVKSLFTRLLLHGVVVWLCLYKNSQLVEFLSRGTEQYEVPELNYGHKNLLQVTIVAIGLYVLLTSVHVVFTTIVDRIYFQDRSSDYFIQGRQPFGREFTFGLIRTGIGFTAIYFSNQIAEFLVKKGERQDGM